jgi:hypothetical protein
MLRFEVTYGKRRETFQVDGNATIAQLRSEVERSFQVPTSRQTFSAPKGQALILRRESNLSSKLVDCGAKIEQVIFRLSFSFPFSQLFLHNVFKKYCSVYSDVFLTPD